MPWMLLLHISTMLCWCGSLLYLPALIANITARTNQLEEPSRIKLPRTIFNQFVTPVALLAIVSGTIIFLQMHIIATWLLVKLTLVCGLVICHVMNGWMILTMEKTPGKPMPLTCLCLGVVSAILITTIIWLVLSKPLLDIHIDSYG